MAEPLTPTAQKLLDKMVRGEHYSKSAMGYTVFGDRNPHGKFISPQGAALAVGRFVRELMEKGYVQADHRRHPCCWYTNHEK